MVLIDATTLAAAGQGAFQGAMGALEFSATGFFAARAADPNAIEDFDYTKALSSVLLGALLGGVAGFMGFQSSADAVTYLTQMQVYTALTGAIQKASQGIVRHIRAAITKAAKKVAPPAK